MIAVWLKTVSLFSKSEQLKIAGLFLCSMIIGVVQIAGIASIMPFIAALTAPDLTATQPFLSKLYNWVGFADHRSYAIALGVFSFCILIVSHVLELIYSWVSVRFINLKEFELSTALLNSYMTNMFERTRTRNTSELSKHILQDVENVISGILFSGMGIVNSSITALFIIGLLLFVDPWVTLSVACTFVACYGLIFLFISPRIRKLGEDVKGLYSQMYVSTQQALDGLKEIKAADREAYFVDKFAQPRKASALNYIRFKTLELIPMQLLEVTAFGAIIAISVYFVYRFENPGLNYSIVGMFAFSAYRIVPMIKEVFDGMEGFNYYRSFLDGIWDDLTRARNANSGTELPATGERIARLELRGIRFRYESRSEPAVNGVNLTITAGERVCLIGPSGAGKTTTVDIILGLLAPQDGEILINDRPVPSAQLGAVRKRLGYVPQTPYLLDDTLTNNILFGDELDEERLAWAYATAGLAEVFGEYTAARQMLIGQHGGRFSGGQRQRIAIARALYRRPDLLVMDESTNGLDLVTEQRLLSQLCALPDTAMLFVSHRPSVMKACQRLLVVETGKIVASGDFATISSNQSYRALML